MRAFVSFRKMAVAAALLASVSQQSASAAVTCWDNASINAAKVREMETMLMVSALRCNVTNKNVLPAYNAFIRAVRPTLNGVNDTLKKFFAKKVSGNGMVAYDAYVTAVANKYGSGGSGMSCDEMTALLGEAALSAGSLDQLITLSDRAGVKPYVLSEQCVAPAVAPVVIAAPEPVAAPVAAAPAPAPAIPVAVVAPAPVPVAVIEPAPLPTVAASGSTALDDCRMSCSFTRSTVGSARMLRLPRARGPNSMRP